MARRKPSVIAGHTEKIIEEWIKMNEGLDPKELFVILHLKEPATNHIDTIVKTREEAESFGVETLTLESNTADLYCTWIDKENIYCPIGTTVKCGTTFLDIQGKEKLTYDPGRINPFGQLEHPKDTAAKLLYRTSNNKDEFLKMMFYLIILQMEKQLFPDIPYSGRVYSSITDCMVRIREEFEKDEQMNPDQISNRAKNILPLYGIYFLEASDGGLIRPTDDEAVLLYLNNLKIGMDKMLEKSCIVGADF